MVGLFGIALAAQVPLIERTEVHDQHGQYALTYSTGDGIAVAQQGALKLNADRTERVIVVQVKIILIYLSFLSHFSLSIQTSFISNYFVTFIGFIFVSWC